MSEKRFYIDTIDGGENVLTDNGKELSLNETIRYSSLAKSQSPVNFRTLPEIVGISFSRILFAVLIALVFFISEAYNV